MKFKMSIFKEKGKWGVGHRYVSKGKKCWSLLYEPDFVKATAQRIAELENSENPPEDWEATREILEREGHAV
jgi:hypothetical protein